MLEGLVRRGFRVWVLGVGVLACTPQTPEAAQSARARVVLAQRGKYYDFAFVPARSLAEWQAELGDGPEAEVAWHRELMELAEPNLSSGALIGPALDSAGAALSVPDHPEIDLRYTCGATLISRSLVITAAHCVAEDVGPSKLQLFRPTPRLATVASNGLTLSGSWPSFSHDSFGEDDGYLLDEYDCDLLVRCDDRWGPTLNCPLIGEQDVAVMECQGEPGAKYGFLPLEAEVPAEGTEVFMAWKHEVYDLQNSSVSEAELLDHYIEKGEVPANFHYHAGNQLLPLRSIPWSNGQPRMLVETSWTDMMGCHGTSGSGLLRADPAGYRLWGIATNGSSDLTDLLCQDSEALAAAGLGVGSGFIGSNWAELSLLAERLRANIDADCLQLNSARTRTIANSPLDGTRYRVSSWFSGLPCQPYAASPLPTEPGFALEARSERGWLLAAGERFEVGPFAVEQGQPYRAGVHVSRPDACDGCTAFELLTGNGSGSFALDANAGVAASAALGLAASETGELTLAVSNSGDPATFSGATLVREGQANTFDTPFERAETSLYAVNGPRFVGPAPARFTGDGERGFSALLRADERLLLSRQALLAERAFTVRLEASSYDGLTCGFVDGAGTALSAVPCERLFTLPSSLVTPSAFFVQAAAGVEDIELRAVALASEAADDHDGDGIADVLEDCSEGPSDCTAVLDAGVPPLVDAGLTFPGDDDVLRSPDAGAAPSELPDAAALEPDGEAPTVAPTTPAPAVADAGRPAPSTPDPPTSASPGAVPATPAPTNATQDAGAPAQSAASEGCGCRVQGGSSGAPWAISLLALLMLRTRRRPLSRAANRRLNVG